MGRLTRTGSGCKHPRRTQVDWPVCLHYPPLGARPSSERGLRGLGSVVSPAQWDNYSSNNVFIPFMCRIVRHYCSGDRVIYIWNCRGRRHKHALPIISLFVNVDVSNPVGLAHSIEILPQIVRNGSQIKRQEGPTRGRV